MGVFHQRPTDQAPFTPGDDELKDAGFVDVLEKMPLPGVERTLALIKPDAVAKGYAPEIMSIIRHQGFTIVAQKRMQLTAKRAQEFYREHSEQPFFPALVEFMTSGPIYALCLSKMSAILSWRELMGPTNSDKARIEFPRSMRALYGTDGRQNAVHGSDSEASAYREVKFFFPKLFTEPPRDSEWAKKYVEVELMPTLTKGLVELAHTRPTANRLEAVVWLADWLQRNNPNKAQLVVGREEMAITPDQEDDDKEFEEAVASLTDVEAAVVKIQAHFRGFKGRQQVEEMKRVSAAGGAEEDAPQEAGGGEEDA